MAVTIMRGDSYPIFLELKQDGRLLTPEMVTDIEVCVGEALRFTYAGKTLAYDKSRSKWYFWPTQEETFSLEEGSYQVYVRNKYPNLPPEVYGYKLDSIRVVNTNSGEVL